MTCGLKSNFTCPSGVSLEEYRTHISEILDKDDDLNTYHWRVARLVGTEILTITKGESSEDVMGRPRDQDEEDEPRSSPRVPNPPPSRNIKVTEEIKRGILSEIPCGEPGCLTAQEIGDKYGVSKGTVYNVRHAATRDAQKNVQEKLVAEPKPSAVVRARNISERTTPHFTTTTIPQPEEVMALAAELQEARQRVAELEACWEALFTQREHDPR